MKYATIERGALTIGLWLHTATDPPPEEWQLACDEVAKVKVRAAGGLASMRMLIVTDGGGPNLSQRGVLNAGVFEGIPVKTVAITTSLANPIKRGLVKAITWTNPSFKAVGPAQWSEALAHLDIAGDASVFDELVNLEVAVGIPNETLTLIRKLTKAAA